ncbi:AI-2E family transporter [Candidatus Epulonipiscium viviparus]|uniref:AI-2E family transporter n=1 Tax=Candidatus Epulonipiscium viviparus TaxID=420336 RepID=UPI00016C074A|nr:AI-2E family transporter [Candidatus Epulopiscium viviparus]
MDKKRIKESIVVVTYAIILYLILINLKTINSTFDTFTTLLMPVITGFIIAYILKGPYNFVRDKVLRMSSKDTQTIQTTKSVIALVMAYTLVILVLTILAILVIPQLWNSIQSLISTLPDQIDILFARFQGFLDDMDGRLDTSVDSEIYTQLEEAWVTVMNFVSAILTDVIPAVLNGIVEITTSITNMIFAFIFSVYFLTGKERLSSQMSRILYAYLPKARAERILYISRITNNSFTNFINGQVAEAFILGILCFVGMLIFKMPYAVLVSVIIGATNIIPIFGPIFGSIPATFIVLMDDPSNPMMAVWFVVFILVMQRIDGDIIYPRVVGDSIGLPGVFVMLAIVIGSGLWGLTGMIIGVPLAAVFYRLIKEGTNLRLAEKEINFE